MCWPPILGDFAVVVTRSHTRTQHTHLHAHNTRAHTHTFYQQKGSLLPLIFYAIQTFWCTHYCCCHYYSFTTPPTQKRQRHSNFSKTNRHVGILQVLCRSENLLMPVKILQRTKLIRPMFLHNNQPRSRSVNFSTPFKLFDALITHHLLIARNNDNAIQTRSVIFFKSVIKPTGWGLLPMGWYFLKNISHPWGGENF